MLVLVVEALLRVARRALKTDAAWALAGAAFLALYALSVPFPLVVLAAALIGYLAPGRFRAGSHGEAKDGPPALLDAVLAADPGRPARLASSAWRAGWAAVALWLAAGRALMLLDAAASSPMSRGSSPRWRW